MGVEKVSEELFNVEIKTTKTSMETSSVRKLKFFLAAELISPKFKLMVTTLHLALKKWPEFTRKQRKCNIP